MDSDHDNDPTQTSISSEPTSSKSSGSSSRRNEDPQPSQKTDQTKPRTPLHSSERTPKYIRAPPQEYHPSSRNSSSAQISSTNLAPLGRKTLTPAPFTMSKARIVKKLWHNELYRLFPNSLINDAERILKEKLGNTNRIKIETFTSPIRINNLHITIYSSKVTLFPGSVQGCRSSKGNTSQPSCIILGLWAATNIDLADKRACFNTIQ